MRFNFVAVALVGGDSALRRHLRRLIDDFEDMACISICRGARSASRLVPDSAPDVVLILDDAAGADLLKRLMPQARILYFRGTSRPSALLRAIREAAFVPHR